MAINESDYPKTWECKVCGTQYTDREKGSGYKCWQGHVLTQIEEECPECGCSVPVGMKCHHNLQ